MLLAVTCIASLFFLALWKIIRIIGSGFDSSAKVHLAIDKLKVASGNRCHYEVLGLERDCTAVEIRLAYRRLALQCHPDKLVKSGLSQAEATSLFQELQRAYDVLSDPKDRAWYDSLRSKILYCDPNSVGNSASNSSTLDLSSFFSGSVYSGDSDTGRGFYKVYSDVFHKIHANEVNSAKKLGLSIDAVQSSPVMGNLDSHYAQASAFYNYWLGVFYDSGFFLDGRV